MMTQMTPLELPALENRYFNNLCSFFFSSRDRTGRLGNSGAGGGWEKSAGEKLSSVETQKSHGVERR